MHLHKLRKTAFFSLRIITLRGFFYLITYQEHTLRGSFIKGDFLPLMVSKRSDWGNPILRWFMVSFRNWTEYVYAVSANDFFKMIIRRHPKEQEVWAWALEWNHSIRVVGFAGDRNAVEDFKSDIPDLPFQVVHEEPGQWMRMRTETPLAESEDDLFTLREEMDDNSNGPTDDLITGTPSS